MIGMDPGAVPEPAEYSSPSSPGGSAIMGEEEVKEMAALTVLSNFLFNSVTVGGRYLANFAYFQTRQLFYIGFSFYYNSLITSLNYNLMPTFLTKG